MPDNPAAHHGAVFQALRDQPRQVEGGVDADGGEVRAAVHAWGKFGGGKDAEVGQHVFEPGVFADELAEPVADGAVGVFVAAVDEVVFGLC